MEQYMNINKELSQSAFYTAPDSQTVYALVKINPADSIDRDKKIPLDIRFVLDHSGSMSAPAGKNNRKTCLDVLKSACKKAVDVLQNDDRVTIYLFAERSKLLLKPRIIKSGKDHNIIKREIDKINYGGGTHLSTSLNDMLRIKNINNYVQRALIFTDGEVNMPQTQKEERDCLNHAGIARADGIPFWVYGTGISYNETFLRGLAERSGGHYEHITKPDDMVEVFKNQMRYFKDISVTNVQLTIDAVPGAILRKISRVIPDIETYTGFQPTYFSTDIPDIDRTRGAAYLIQLELTPTFNGVCPLLDINIVYDVPVMGLAGVSQSTTLSAEFVDDPSLIQNNKGVMDIVTMQGAHDLTTVAAEKAETGQIDLATRMMNQAAQLYNNVGANNMATNLMTLSNSVQKNGGIKGQSINTRRTLTTVSSQLITRHLTNSGNNN